MTYKYGIDFGTTLIPRTEITIKFNKDISLELHSTLHI